MAKRKRKRRKKRSYSKTPTIRKNEPAIRKTDKWIRNYKRNEDDKKTIGTESDYRKFIDRITEGPEVDNNNLMKSFDDFIKRRNK